MQGADGKGEPNLGFGNKGGQVQDRRIQGTRYRAGERSGLLATSSKSLKQETLKGEGLNILSASGGD